VTTRTPGAYAAVLRRLSGTRPVVVLSDDPTASRKIAAFTDSGDRWMVAVRMVSEGVDIPRLAVGVYATSVGTALFFARRWAGSSGPRQRGRPPRCSCPRYPALLGYAAGTGGGRDHVLAASRTTPKSASWPRRSASGTPRTPAPSSRSRPCRRPAHFDRFSTTAASSAPRPRKRTSFGLPGLLEPEQVALLLRKRQASGSSGAPGLAARARRPQARGEAFPAWAASVAANEPRRRRPAGSRPRRGRMRRPRRPSRSAGKCWPCLRKELNGLIGAWHHRHRAAATRWWHAYLRRACGGPALPQATAEQIQARIDTIRGWARSGR